MNKIPFLLRVMVTAGFLYTLSALQSIQAQALVGTLPGEVSVDNKGNANYTIFLPVPAGRNGLQPKLALVYNSQSTNAELGAGWSISTGFYEAISRGRPIFARHGYINALGHGTPDRLYLDGRLLIQTNETTEHNNDAYWQPDNEYRTEVESFAKVYSYGIKPTAGRDGILGFLLADKSGNSYYFGKVDDDDNAIHRLGLDGELNGLTYRWRIRKVVDSLGNSIIFRYRKLYNEKNELTGEHLLDGIDYTASESGVVTFGIRFIYEERPDKFNGWLGGRKTTLSRRLEHIIVGPLNGPDVADCTKYTFSYETALGSGLSRLKSVAQWGKSSVQSNWEQLPSTTFTYHDDNSVSSIRSPEVLSLPTGLYFHGNDSMTGIRGDFNGDGIPDLFAYENGVGKIFLGNGTGYNEGIPWITFSSASGRPPPIFVKVGDINGDGLTDIVWMSGVSVVYAAVSTGTSFTGISGGGASFVALESDQNERHSI